MSEVKVNKISQRSGTDITLGNSGTDFILPTGAAITIQCGATITNNGSATGFGATGAVNWDTTPKTTTVTAVSGVGYFVDTTSGAVTVNLPAGVAGSIVAVSDYANTSASNNITITPNGTDKINGLNENATISTEGAGVTLIYVDSTRGWKDVNDATLNVSGINPFIVATGGTITCDGDYKIHTFTGPGTFTVSCAGSPLGSNSVDYLVIAGGGGGGAFYGGGGAGGFRYSNSTFSVACAPGAPLASATGLPVSAQGYPITIGSGGSGGSSPNTSTAGNSSVFSTITSAGGGRGNCNGSPVPQMNGGSGGGGGTGACGSSPAGGVGNTPPVAPPQGNPGGTGNQTGGVGDVGGGGGGATAAGSAGVQPYLGGPGGAGSGIPSAFGTNGVPGPSPSYRYYAGGGGAKSNSTPGVGGVGGGGDGLSPSRAQTAGGTNTGGGGGGGPTAPLGNGGSGTVVIRYKFQ